MRAKLYGMGISHPANAARLMLELKGIPYDLVKVQPGAQAVQMRLAGFRNGTVPGLMVDERRAEGSRAIARLLDELAPEPPLFPADPERRRAVEEAEAWGEEVLQPIPRRLLRHALSRDHGARTRFARMAGTPAPAAAAVAIAPVAAFYARREGASSRETVERDLRELPAHLDRVDALIADGVLGGEQLNAADFQIGTTLRVLLAMEDFTSLVETRPGEALARRVWPRYRWSVPRLWSS